MPASVALNVNDPVLAGRSIRKQVFTQLQKRSPFFATLFGLMADRKKNGEECHVINVGSHEVLQRDIESGEVTDSGPIAPSASITTAVSKNIPTFATALYGGLTLDRAACPMSLNEYIHGGPGARHKFMTLAKSSIVNILTRSMLAQFFSAGAGANADGLLKWTSKTANKWGLDTSAAGNYYFRGQVEGVASAAFDEDLVREWIRIARSGQVTEGGVTYYSDISLPSLGIVDTKTFNRMRKWVSDRQHIEMTRTGELAKLGGFFGAGVIIDEVTFLPDLKLDEKRDDNSSEGEMFLIDPEAFEVIFLKGFNFTFITNPNEAMGKDGSELPLENFADVVWGKYAIMRVLWNIFCEHPRNQLYGQIT